MKCSYCKRPLTNPEAIASGIGPICAKRKAAAIGSGIGAKITFMSHPRTGRHERRTWVYSLKGCPTYFVRIYPDPKGDGRTATCDCPAGKAAERCMHVDQVGKVDAGKFLKMEIKQND